MEDSSLLKRILEVRGITEKDEIDKFLNPNLDEDWTNPYDICGMEDVANVIEEAMRKGSHITIFGDYDVDGITATCVMMMALKEIDKHINAGMTIDYFLPDRFSEGYGLSKKSVARFLSSDNLPNLVITVDCGITSAAEISDIKKAGIDVVVTDHHERGETEIDEVPWIDPKANNTDSENAILSGVGVVLKLIDCLGSRLGLPNLWKDYVDFASLGTLADVMPLIGQNRALVAEGINIINRNPRASIRAMLDVAGKTFGELTSTDIAFTITPRINSAGRMNKPSIAVDLLLSEDYTQAYNFAIELEDLNNQRREITTDLIDKANYRAKIIMDNNPMSKSLVLYGKNWHNGVLGIVAAKIAEKYNVPCFVLSVENDEASGSGRSVGNINLHKACKSCFNKFLKFGGHASACGATIYVDDIPEFSESLNNYMQKLDKQYFQKSITTDLELSLHELNIDDVESLNVLEPYGFKNEEPCFLTKNVFIKRARAVGSLHNHLSCNITDGAYGGQGIMFNVEDIDKYLKCDGTVSVLYNLKTECFQGQKYVKLHMKNITPDNLQVDNVSENSNYLDELFNSYESKNLNQSGVGDFIQNSINELHNEKIENKILSNNENLFDNSFNREKFGNLSASDVQDSIVKAFIGEDGKLHSSQNETLEKLMEGKSVLSVMPTGRGKSLIFQVFAATSAIKDKKTSIFVYPLRALISDQAFHLEKSLSKFCLRVEVLNGETPQSKRDEIYSMLKNGLIDIVLTTPEFLAIHIDKIAENAKIGFVVIDESHHMGQVKIGDRTAYGHMPNIIEKLGQPQVLALSATVNDEVCAEIKKFLPIEYIVKDNFERKNLYVDDRRNIKSRDDYLVSICASGQKIVIYVNSRQQTVDLARMIKSRAPHIAMKVGFYNAGMTKQDRKKIESLFRDNKLSVLVATSAFGEGVNIPDIRHVCLYHLPFSNVEFNQMAGRCGRDNQPAIVHLLYNRADATINTQILEASNPGRDLLGKIFIWIKNTSKNLEGDFEICNDKLMQMFQQHLIPAPPGAILCALDVFSELDLIKVETYHKEGSSYSKIAICEMATKVNLENSSRFCEGQNEINNFEEYRHNAMRRTADDLTQLFRHPILPSDIF